MSIAVLTQVHDETRRLAIAGSNLASGDFRLKKLVAPLEASAAKASIFGKVAEAVTKLVDSNSKTSAEALLELSTLVSAVLYTQGETGASGKLTPIETTNFGLASSNSSARLLKPLIESLTTTGSGREEIIKDAHQRGAFQDLRLVRLAVKGLDDPYAPIAEYLAEQVLPIYGKAIYDDLLATYNPKAKGGQVRRLKLMHRLDAEKTYPLVEQALESGSPDMKVAAIQCLEGREESLSFLLEQAKAKSGDVRRAALQALAKFMNDEVITVLIKSLSGADLAMAALPASQNRSPKLLEFLLLEGDKQLSELLALKDKEKLKKSLQRFYEFLFSFSTRDDKGTLAFLTKCFEKREALIALKGDTNGEQIVRRAASLLINVRHKPGMKLIVDAQAALSADLLDRAILAAVLTLKPKEVYDLFSPYYLAKVDKKKKNDEAAAKLETVREMLTSLSSDRHHRYGYFGYGGDEVDLKTVVKDHELDPRWLDAAMSTQDTEIVTILARPKHKPTLAYLSQAFKDLVSSKEDLGYQAWNLLETMVRIEHPQVVEHFLAALQRVASKKQTYYSYWLTRIIPSLPKSAVAPIEAMLPTMDEKLADQVAPYLAELQTKQET